MAADQALFNDNNGYFLRGLTLGAGVKYLPEQIPLYRIISKGEKAAPGSLDSRGSSWILADSMDPSRFWRILWILVDSSGFYGFYWILLDSSGFLWS
ncbi:unnamed protein product [Rotaria socialis]